MSEDLNRQAVPAVWVDIDTEVYYPISALLDTGVLWLINKSVFHPRGFALTLVKDQDTGDIKGWTLQGDGTEPWAFTTEVDDEKFTMVETLFEYARIFGKAPVKMPPMDLEPME